MNESKNMLCDKGNSFLKLCEFKIADENELKTLASKVGQVQVRDIPFIEFNGDFIIKTKHASDNQRQINTREGVEHIEYEPRYEHRNEYVPTFGMNNGESGNRHYSQKYYQNQEYDRNRNKAAQSLSPARPQKYTYEPSEEKQFQKEEPKLKSFSSNKLEHYEEGNRNLGNSWRDTQVIANNAIDKASIYEKYTKPSNSTEYLINEDNRRGRPERPNSRDYDVKSIDEIKRKYARHDRHDSVSYKEINTDIRNEFENQTNKDLKAQNNKDVASYYNEAKTKMTKEDYMDGRIDYGKETVIRKFKAKPKDEKENSLKVLKLKIK